MEGEQIVTVTMVIKRPTFEKAKQDVVGILNAWFGDVPPFPDGALLHYSIHPEDNHAVQESEANAVHVR